MKKRNPPLGGSSTAPPKSIFENKKPLYCPQCGGLTVACTVALPPTKTPNGSPLVKAGGRIFAVSACCHATLAEQEYWLKDCEAEDSYP